jgi:TonB family protein
MSDRAFRALILALSAFSGAARAGESECAGVLERIRSEDGKVHREVCHDSSGVTIPYNDFPLPHRPLEIEPSSVTHFEASDFTLGCCCPPDASVPLIRVEPDYPPEAKQAGIKGWVDVSGSLTPEGRIQDAQVVDSSPKGVFDEAALRAFSRWTYTGEIEPGSSGIARICFPSPFLTVSARDASVVAFVRPPKDRHSEAFVSAIDHLQSALSEIAACLGIEAGRVQLLEAETVTIRSDERDFTFSPSRTSGVGAVLLSAEKPPQEVASPADAQSLPTLLPDAVAAYFGAPGCKH